MVLCGLSHHSNAHEDHKSAISKAIANSKGQLNEFTGVQKLAEHVCRVYKDVLDSRQNGKK